MLEFASSVLNSVQRGMDTDGFPNPASSSIDVTISSVDTNFAVAALAGGMGDTSNHDDLNCHLTLTSSTNIRFERTVSASTTYGGGWEVWEFNENPPAAGGERRIIRVGAAANDNPPALRYGAAGPSRRASLAAAR